METYFIQGIVLPERSPITYEFSSKFQHVATGQRCSAKVSILLNQVAVWLDTEEEMSFADLKNLSNYMVLNLLYVFSFLNGYTYDFQVTRAINRERNADVVFGIDHPVIAARRPVIDYPVVVKKVQAHLLGDQGVFIHRCLGDLSAAMRFIEDSAFYCYRAIESLRKHCAAIHGITDASKTVQWEKFREVSGFSKEKIGWIAEASKESRHGGTSILSIEENEKLLNETWDIVDSYLKV
jgi:hypothetical protein